MGLSDRERAAYEAHIESLKEQVAWLRSQLESSERAEPAPAPPMESGALWVREEEEDLQDMVAEGLIDEAEAARILEATGALSTEIEFAPTR